MFEPMNYTVKLWTEDDIVDIVKNKYPWLLSTYQSYSQNIQRADVARLVVLHAEGGMYADLDVHPRSFEAISCLQSLDLQGIFAPTSGALGLSNHFFMAEKGSAFLHWALHEAKRRGGATSKRILLPYLQVFWSTGPLMVTSAYSQYAWAISPTSTEIGVLDEDYGGSVIGHEAGRSWHSADGQILNYLGDNLRLESPWVIVPLLFAILVLLTIIARRYMRGKKSAYLRLG
ncbi:hypothetical protein CDD83_1756 [Cordyceps sp. RAO-2017]|nr:hypothetical protein CDD83_1756 [Cordyceps sp. RAO-2017]